MSQPPASQAPSVGRFTGLVLGLVAFVCVTMIVVAGYLGYQLDHAEMVLAAPEAALGTEGFDKMRRDLGYGGFIGLAQNFATTHDAAQIPEMRAQLKEAEDMLGRLPDKTTAEVRHDLQSILATFTAAMHKAENSVPTPAVPMPEDPFTKSDLVPLYAALPVLDYRIASVAAVNRLEAQNQAQFWAMLLTLVSWASLVIASAMAAGIYLTLRDRNSAPLRALAQSVKNMTRGDMRTSIWGMERHDMVGELARAVDLARYQFSQLPDMSLLSDEGPVRLRFEGNTRSLFEAMMRVISRDSEQVHKQTNDLNDAITKQQETLALIVSRVEAVLQNVENRAVHGDQQVRQALTNMVGSAQSLKASQEHAADQLNRIIPYLQERARGLSEITQLTGKQVASVLQSLILSERGIRTSAAHSDEAIRKLSTTADGLSERLFGAVNLLQASGKVLAETTEKTQSKLDEAIESLRVNPVTGAMPAREADSGSAYLDDITPRIGIVVEALEQTQARMESLLAEHSDTASQTLVQAADRLREEQTRFDGVLGQFAARMDDVGAKLEAKTVSVPAVATALPSENSQEIRVQLAELAAQVGDVSQKIGILAGRENKAADATREPAFVSTLLMEIKTGFEVMGNSLERTREQVTNIAIRTQAEPTDIAALMKDQWQTMAGQIEATRSGLAQIINQEIARLEQRLAGLQNEPAPQAAVADDALRDAQAQMEQQTQILSELVTTLGVLDAHMQEIRSQVSGLRQAG